MKAGYHRLAMAVTALAASVPLAARAPTDPDAAARAAQVAQIETAFRVAEWARANQDAQGLVTAAALLADVETRAAVDAGRIEASPPVPTAPAPAPPPPASPPPAPPPASGVQRAPTARGSADAADASAAARFSREKAVRAPITVDALLDEAERLSDGDPGLLATIAARRQQAAKGVAFSSLGTGPIRATRDIPARAMWRLELTAHAGTPLRIVAIGDGDTDVDIEVRDANGRLVCTDRSPGHYATCALTPAFSGRYIARIVNNGMIWTRATVVSN